MTILLLTELLMFLQLLICYLFSEVFIIIWFFVLFDIFFICISEPQ